MEVKISQMTNLDFLEIVDKTIDEIKNKITDQKQRILEIDKAVQELFRQRFEKD